MYVLFNQSQFILQTNNLLFNEWGGRIFIAEIITVTQERQDIMRRMTTKVKE